MPQNRVPRAASWWRRFAQPRPAVARPAARLGVERVEDRVLLAAAAGTTSLLVQTAMVYRADALGAWLGDHVPAGAAVETTRIPGLFEVVTPSPGAAELAARIRATPGVDYVEENGTVHVAQTPNDPKFTDGTMYGLNGTYGIRAPQAWDITTGSSAVTVAVLDTGIDYNHPDLYKNIWIDQAEIPGTVRTAIQSNPTWDVNGNGAIDFWDLNVAANQGPGKVTDLDANGRITAADILKPAGAGGWSDGTDPDGDGFQDDLIGWNFVADTNDPMDDYGHGTHVAGTVGAVGNNGIGVVGVNWNVRLMAVKIIGGNGNGSDLDAAEAIHYAADQGAPVSNNSWGGVAPENLDAVRDAIAYAETKNHLFVAAAGNESSNTDDVPFYPASFDLPNIVSVAATTRTGALAGFSNWGPVSVDLAAPGENIYSTFPGGGYGDNSGTSMATPHAAGAAALVLAAHPGMGYAQLKGRLIDRATPLSTLTGLVASGGLLNAYAAVRDGPEIQVRDGPTVLADGTSAVDFGATDAGVPVSKTFAVQNLGYDPLTLTGPIGVPTGFTVTSGFGATTLAPGASTTFTVRFDAPAAGVYTGTLSFGTNDPAHDPFDFTITGAVSLVRFDFGTGSSPVAPGYTRVTAATAYSAAAGYGWQSGQVFDYDRGAGTDLTRDFNYTHDPAGAVFAADVPNGAYTVRVLLGDTAFGHDQVGVFLEGTQVDTVTTAAGQVVTNAYPVAVTDGQLTLTLRDLGGANPDAVLVGLEVVPAGPPAADMTGPRVTASTPAGTVGGPVAAVTIDFNESIADGTFTLADVVSLTGPGGAIIPAGVTKVTAARYQVTFAPQSATGGYSLVIGPDIRDAAGNPMDQNGNGTNGEVPGDRYTAAFTISPPPPVGFPLRYDFGTGSSPVAAGYMRVTAATAYSAAQGYGWQSGAVADFDRGTGTDLTRDFNYTTNGTFAADVPNGTYTVTVGLGESVYAHDQMGVFLEGVQVDSVTTTAATPAVEKTYTVAVTDGQLTLTLRDLGGANPDAVITHLVVTPGGTSPPPPPPPPPPAAAFDFGTGSSPVAAGYTRVTAATAYSAAQGYGWQSGQVFAFDRGGGDPLTRDFVYTHDPAGAVFAVDLANGTYTATVRLGDTGFAHDQMGVAFEGGAFDSVDNAAGQVVTRSYTVVIADGQLNLTLKDLGGTNPDAVLIALDISAVP